MSLRSIGFKTALDDFGTGYSSLAYLCNFKFDKIKIDRSFVGRIARVDISRTIVQSVVTIGRGLGMDIVAEGVETEFEAMMMTKLGCTELQGYYFSKPVDADQTANLLKTFQPESLSPSLLPMQLSVSPRDRRIDADLGFAFGRRVAASRIAIHPGSMPCPRTGRQRTTPRRPAMPTTNGRGSIPKLIFSIITGSRIPTTTASSAARWRR